MYTYAVIEINSGYLIVIEFYLIYVEFYTISPYILSVCLYRFL